MNRIARGSQTDEDLKILSQRIKQKDDPSIPEDALFIYSVNADVTEQNENHLSKLEGQEIVCKALVRHNILKNFTPIIERDGSIKGTPLQNELKVKIGAEVMLTYNIDVVDGLTNGAFGKIVGFEFDENKKLKFIMIEFYSDVVGKERRNKYPGYKAKYPKATAIGLHEAHYNVENRFSTSSSKATAINYPLKLSFAVTGHRVQGQTVLRPKYAVTDLKKARFPGQAYVMLSRVESMDQLIILDSLYDEKWRVCKDALETVETIERNAMNLELGFDQGEQMQIISLNIRSLKNMKHLIQDRNFRSSSLVCLQEIWHQSESNETHNVSEFQQHFNTGPVWRGNGIACYMKDEFRVVETFWEPEFQLSKVSNGKYDIVNVYFKNSSEKEFLFCLKSLITDFSKTIIVGDFNINFKEKGQSAVLKWLDSKNFMQLVKKSTHIMGGLIDHVWVPENLIGSINVNQKGIYFSDHDMIVLTLER